MSYIVAFVTGIIVTAIGAFPFGLVNLSVLNISYRMGVREGMRIAHGAAVIEVLFGFTAVMAGVLLHRLYEENNYISYILVAILMVVGIFFLLKRNGAKETADNNLPPFVKGMFLNLISVQVLLYWIIAIAFLHDHYLFSNSASFIFMFLAGIWAGKMGVLWIFARSGRVILAKSNILSKNINRIIGSILIIAGIIQMLK
jgi:threonine/homoserine/homoserine lactone efflux protein